MFNVLLGAFLNDVVLKNITFSTGVLTVDECKAAGFTIREHGYPNGTKGFSIQVPFDDDVVLKRVCGVNLMVDQASASWLSRLICHITPQNPKPLDTLYSLPLVFGFLILPEKTAFSHSVEVEASLQDVGEMISVSVSTAARTPQQLWLTIMIFPPLVLPTIAATCDYSHFYVSVKYGNQGNNFETTLGPQQLSSEVKQEYNYRENGTHFSLDVPYDAKASVFEVRPDQILDFLDQICESFDFIYNFLQPSGSGLLPTRSQRGLTCCCTTPLPTGISLTSPWPAASL